jgi:serine protease Do
MAFSSSKVGRLRKNHLVQGDAGMKRLGSLLFAILLYLGTIGFGIPELKADSYLADSISDVFKEVSPAVVLITATSIDPFKIINRVKTGIGSGFIISKDGLILTNSHVVVGSQHIVVTLDNGAKVVGKLIGADPILDLAVLKIPKPPEGLPVISMGDSNAIQVGEQVLVIGNPLGLEQTLTLGIISGVNRILPGSLLGLTLPLIQTDAAISPGNSGGPLVNRYGEVIGITTSFIYNAQNIGFALPIKIAKEVIPQLVEQGRVIRPWVGIHGKLVKKEALSIINIPLVDGFLVETVEPGSPAERGGVRGGELPITIVGAEFLLGGDIITAINGESVADPEKFIKLVRSLKVGDKVNLLLYRQMKTLNVEVTLPERPILSRDFPTDIPRNLLLER